MRKMRLHVLVVAIAALPVFAYAQSNKPTKVTNPGAIVTFGYCAADPDPALCATQNRVRNDYAYPYTNGQDGVSAVFNLVSGSRDLTVGLNLSRRAVTFDFTDHVAGSATPAWWSANKVLTVQPYFNVLKAYYAKENCTTPDPITGNYDCDLVTAMNAGQWTAPGSNATMAAFWNPAATTRPVNSPETTSRVNVHYHKDSASESFTVTPIVNNNGLIVAGVEANDKRTVSSAGQYIMPFTMAVTLQ